MKRTHFARLLAAVLCLCLLPGAALAFNGDDSPVTRSECTLCFTLMPDGFPNDGLAHYADIAAFLQKLSLRGTLDTQHPLGRFNRIFFDGGLYLNDKLTVPFTLDSYANFRYVRSPAFDGASVHFQMNNFLEFMLKGYYYLELPTNLIGVVLYPQGFAELADMYASSSESVLGGEGSRTVSYEDLENLCYELDSYVYDDEVNRVGSMVTAMFVNVDGADLILEKLNTLENFLAACDPDQVGLTITSDEDGETWQLGDEIVYEKDANGFSVHLPDSEGFVFDCFCYREEDALGGEATITLDDEPWLDLQLEVSGLPEEGGCTASGEIAVTLTGSALPDPIAPFRFRYDWSRSAPECPCHTTLAVDWINPATDKSAVGLRWEADDTLQDASVLVERPYDDQEDFFHLNDTLLQEYKERFTPALLLSAMPIVFELPLGVISDAAALLQNAGVLSVLGLQ